MHNGGVPEYENDYDGVFVQNCSRAALTGSSVTIKNNRCGTSTLNFGLYVGGYIQGFRRNIQPGNSVVIQTNKYGYFLIKISREASPDSDPCEFRVEYL